MFVDFSAHTHTLFIEKKKHAANISKKESEKCAQIIQNMYVEIRRGENELLIKMEMLITAQVIISALCDVSVS